MEEIREKLTMVAWIAAGFAYYVSASIYIISKTSQTYSFGM